MEYATDSLDQYISRICGTSDVNESLKIILRIIDCVYFIHKNNVIHRDLHPGNWLLIKGKFKVSDFGLSCYISDDHSGKGYKPLYGAPDYTAPEQLQSLENTSEQSDIYSIGKLINFVLTKSPQKYNHILHDISEKCTRKDPQNRYSNVFEIKVDIQSKLKVLDSSSINQFNE